MFMKFESIIILSIFLLAYSRIVESLVNTTTTISTTIQTQEINKPFYASCKTNEECGSKSCVKNKCLPKTCRNDLDCIRAGLRDTFCKRRGIHIFASEW